MEQFIKPDPENEVDVEEDVKDTEVDHDDDAEDHEHDAEDPENEVENAENEVENEVEDAEVEDAEVDGEEVDGDVGHEVPTKKKKGRPKKEQNLDPNTDEKKKRGRKKKEISAEDLKQKKKRGRKAAVKYFSSSIRKKIPLTTILQDSNNFILHLDIKDEEVQQMESTHMTFDSNNQNTNIFEQIKNENQTIATQLEKEYNHLVENGDSLLQDIYSNDNNHDNDDDHDNLSELYEKRLKFREHEDSIIKKEINTEPTSTTPTPTTPTVTTTETTNTNKHNTNTNKNDLNRKKGFFEVMYDFVHNEKWLETTDVCCWWCCHSFDSVPIGLPMDYNGKFRVKGVFCSFSCMIAYKNEKHLYSKDHLIKFLYKRLTGTMLKDSLFILKPAPPRCSLKMFGGELSIEEFRNCFNENKCYKMIDYPMYISKDYIEEVDIQNVKNVNQKVFQETFSHSLDDKRIEDAKSRLSQIEKTTVTLGNTIDQFIKIQ